jgi:predicted enzyme related to lactoylglutathione lyase
MGQTSSSIKQQKPGASATGVAMKLEVHVIPVSDLERSKQFYERLGWRFDADTQAVCGSISEGMLTQAKLFLSHARAAHPGRQAAR